MGKPIIMKILSTSGIMRHLSYFRWTNYAQGILLILTITLLIMYTHIPDSPVPFPVVATPLRKSSAPSITVSGHNKPLVSCMIVTSSQYHEPRAQHVAATWAPECHHHFFLTDQNHPQLKHVLISNFTTYNDLWGKVLEGYRSISLDTAEWFLKADDDTFIIYPNLIEFLAQYDSNKPFYMGLPLRYTFEDGMKVDFMSGGSGYVLSREALRRLKDSTDSLCSVQHSHTKYEDVNMGLCMDKLGVKWIDSRDSLGRHRFLPYPPWLLLDKNLQTHKTYNWLQKLSIYPFEFGLENLSDRVISFHEVRDPRDMYLLYYTTRHLHIA